MLHNFRRPCRVAFRVHTSRAHHRSRFLPLLSASQLALPDRLRWVEKGSRSRDRARRPYNIIKAQVKAADRSCRKGRATRRKEKETVFFFFNTRYANLLSPVRMTNGIQDQRCRSESLFNSAVERFKEAHIRAHVGVAVWVMNSRELTATCDEKCGLECVCLSRHE